MIVGSISTASTCFAPCFRAAATSVPDPAPRISTFSKRVAKNGVRPLIEVFLVVHRRHRLVKDVVHLDDGVRSFVSDGDLVVRRPERAARHDVNERQRHAKKDARSGATGGRRGAGRPGSGNTMSGSAAASATPNQTPGGSSSHEISANATHPREAARRC